jgi:hypothetical protein
VPSVNIIEDGGDIKKIKGIFIKGFGINNIFTVSIKFKAQAQVEIIKNHFSSYGIFFFCNMRRFFCVASCF